MRKLLFLLIFMPIFSYAQQLYPFPKDGKWGYINASGQIVVKPIYESASFFSDRLARVAKLDNRKEHVYGFINPSGREVISPKFQSVSDFQDGIARVKVRNGYQVLLKNGRLITANTFDEIFPATNGMSVVRQGAQYGYINTDGELVIQPIFSKAFPFSDNGRAVVSTNESRYKYGVINKQGQFVIDPDYIQIKPFVNGFSAIAERSNQWIVIDSDGAYVSDKAFQDVGQFANGLINVKSNALWGYMNSAGEMIISPQFAVADYFSNGLAIVGNRRNFTYIDTLGRTLTPYTFTRVTRFDGKLARISQGNQNGFMNGTGKFNLSDKISSIGSFYNERARMKFGSFYGYYGQTGKLEVKPKYLYASDFKDDLALTLEPVVGGYKVAYLDKGGRSVYSWDVLSKPVPQHNDILNTMIYPSVPFYKESDPGSLVIIKIPYGEQISKTFQRTATPLTGQGLSGYLYSAEYFTRPGYIYSESATSFPVPNIGMGLNAYFREKFGVLLETSSPYTYNKPVTVIFFNGTTLSRSVNRNTVEDTYVIPFMKVSDSFFIIAAALGYPQSEYPTGAGNIANFLKKENQIRFVGRRGRDDVPTQYGLQTPEDGQITVVATDLGIELTHRYTIPTLENETLEEEILFSSNPKDASIEQISTNDVQIQMPTQETDTNNFQVTISTNENDEVVTNRVLLNTVSTNGQIIIKEISNSNE